MCLRINSLLQVMVKSKTVQRPQHIVVINNSNYCASKHVNGKHLTQSVSAIIVHSGEFQHSQSCIQSHLLSLCCLSAEILTLTVKLLFHLWDFLVAIFSFSSQVVLQLSLGAFFTNFLLLKLYLFICSNILEGLSSQLFHRLLFHLHVHFFVNFLPLICESIIHLLFPFFSSELWTNEFKYPFSFYSTCSSNMLVTL